MPTLNLKDSGCDVRVGLREGSRSIEAAEEAGLRVTDMATAAEEADLIMVLVPDELQPEVYETYIAPHLKTGDTSLSPTASTSTTATSPRLRM